MKNKLIHILIIFFIAYLNLIAQSTLKKIIIDGKINIIEISKNYLAIRSVHEGKNIAYLIDKNGNKIFEKKNFVNTIIQAIPLEKLNCFLVAVEGSASQSEIPGIDGTIKAFNIQNGNKLWETQCNALKYEVSPNEKHILTKVAPHEIVCPLEIIDLKNGSKIATGINNWDYVAWLDNKRIVIVNQIMERNKDNIKLKKENFSNIVRKKHNLKYKFKKGEISSEEYIKAMAELEIEKNNLYKKNLNSTRRKNSSLHTWVFKATKIRIYNLETNEIEMEESAYDTNGKPIFVARDIDNKTTLSVDRNGHIYLYGFRKDNYDTPKKKCLVKFDTNIKPIWKINIEEILRLKKIIYQNDIKFVIYEKREIIGIIDNQLGYISNNKEKLDTDKIKEIVLSEIPGLEVIKFNGLEINVKENSVLFHTQED